MNPDTVYYGQPPQQTEFPRWRGNPEGVYYAPPGYVLMDWDTGEMYRKTTRQEFNTGWAITLELGGAASGAHGMSRAYRNFDHLRTEDALVEDGYYWLRGVYNLGDQMGGPFVYNPASFAPDDNYNTIMPNIKTPDQSGRWERDAG